MTPTEIAQGVVDLLAEQKAQIEGAPVVDNLTWQFAAGQVAGARLVLHAIRESGGSLPEPNGAVEAFCRPFLERETAQAPHLNKTGGSVTWEETGDTIAPCCFFFPMETPPGGVWTCPECGASWRRDQDQGETMGTVRRLEGAALALALNKTGGSDTEGK